MPNLNHKTIFLKNFNLKNTFLPIFKLDLVLSYHKGKIVNELLLQITSKNIILYQGSNKDYIYYYLQKGI